MSLWTRIARRLPSLRAAKSWWADKGSWGSWSHLVPGGTVGHAGIPVDEDRALALTAAYAAINVIASDVSMLPLKLYRRRPDGGRDQIRDHPISELLAVSPDGETTASRWRQALMGHVLGWGNAYAEITYRGGTPAGLFLLDPKLTHAERRPQDQHLFYRHGAGTLPRNRVIHVAGLGFDGLSGYSPIRMAREAIGLGLAAEAFGATFFGNSSVPKGVLQHPGKLSPEARKNMREGWEQVHGGTDNAHRVAVLWEGTTWQQTTIPPDDAQFLETRKFQVVEVARMFRLALHKIGDYSESHLSNIEASNIDHLATALMPWLIAVEDEFDFKLLTPAERAAGFYLEHDVNAILRGDIKTRYTVHEIAMRNGLRTRNEVRELENENPIPADQGGDIYTVQAQMIPLEQVGKSAPPAAQASQARPNPAESMRAKPQSNGHAIGGRS